MCVCVSKTWRSSRLARGRRKKNGLFSSFASGLGLLRCRHQLADDRGLSLEMFQQQKCTMLINSFQLWFHKAKNNFPSNWLLMRKTRARAQWCVEIERDIYINSVRYILKRERKKKTHPEAESQATHTVSATSIGPRACCYSRRNDKAIIKKTFKKKIKDSSNYPTTNHRK